MNVLDFNLLRQHLSENHVLFGYIFGSQASGKNSATSDIDIAIFIDEKIPKAERVDLRLRFSNELSYIYNKQVDVIVLNEASYQLAYEIIKNGKLIFCLDREKMVETEILILSKYLDRRYYDKRRAEIILNKMRGL